MESNNGSHAIRSKSHRLAAFAMVSALLAVGCGAEINERPDAAVDRTDAPKPIATIALGDGETIEFVEPSPGELVVAAQFKSPDRELEGIAESPLKVYELYAGQPAPTALIEAYARSQAHQQGTDNRPAVDHVKRTEETSEPGPPMAVLALTSQDSFAMSGSTFESTYCSSTGDFDWHTYTGCRPNRTGLWRIQRDCYTMGTTVHAYRGNVHFRNRTLYGSTWTTNYERDIPQGTTYKMYVGGNWRTRLSEVTDSTGDGFHTAFWGDPVLIRTRWAQDGVYAMHAPGQQRLGCWATAFAQIMYYHQKAPSGNVLYTCADGTRINETVGAPAINWSLIAPTLDASSPADVVNETAHYSYDTSVVVQKDFGTGSYVLSSSAIASEIESHYGIGDVSIYASPASQTMQEIEDIIKAEIDARRPVFLYLQSQDGSQAHAMVIDEYDGARETFSIHINMGGGGVNDGFYDFYQQIRQWDDNDYRRIMTVHP